MILHLILLLALNAHAGAPEVDEPELLRTSFLTGLKEPWDLAFAPDGAALFTEKCRGLSVRKKDGTVHHLFGTEGAAMLAPDFFCESQSGMLGVALDPSFAKNRAVYVYMASKTNEQKSNRIVRLKVDENYGAVSDRTDIVTDIPYKQSRNAWGGPGNHSGGRLRFGPDGFLYVTTGDNHNGTIPQDLKSLGGKVLRVDRDGKAARGNKSKGDLRIFTYGHRNVQGICFHPATSQPYVSEHGPFHSDEVTPLVAGGNGGWDPKPESGVACADNYCGYVSNKADGALTPMTDRKKFPHAMKPVFVLEDSQGMSPCAFLTGKEWKQWNGALAVGILAGQRIEVLELGSRQTVAKRSIPDLPSERMRSLVEGRDNKLYVVTDGGTIWALSPKN